MQYSGSSGSKLLIKRGQRNNELFKAALREVRHCDDPDSLIDAITTINGGLPEPLTEAEIMRIAASAWEYETTGRNWVGHQPRAALEAHAVKQLSMVRNGADALMLLANIQVAHGARHSRGEPFAISPDAMSGTVLNWGARRIRKARQTLIDLGLLCQTHQGGRSQHDPSLFRLGK